MRSWARHEIIDLRQLTGATAESTGKNFTHMDGLYPPPPSPTHNPSPSLLPLPRMAAVIHDMVFQKTFPQRDGDGRGEEEGGGGGGIQREVSRTVSHGEWYLCFVNVSSISGDFISFLFHFCFYVFTAYSYSYNLLIYSMFRLLYDSIHGLPFFHFISSISGSFYLSVSIISSLSLSLLSLLSLLLLSSSSSSLLLLLLLS